MEVHELRLAALDRAIQVESQDVNYHGADEFKNRRIVERAAIFTYWLEKEEVPLKVVSGKAP